MDYLEIFTQDKKIRIASINDLSLLPDKSIQLLISNTEYMTTLYAYILYRVDAYLITNNYSINTRMEYFSLCLKNLESLTHYEKEFLINNSTPYVIKIEKFPEEFEKIYRESVVAVCNFFSGALSTTSHLDNNLFLLQDKQTVRHNYGNMISALLGSIV